MKVVSMNCRHTTTQHDLILSAATLHKAQVGAMK
jgi:hypothetical protein